jgi:hypothetical protein
METWKSWNVGQVFGAIAFAGGWLMLFFGTSVDGPRFPVTNTYKLAFAQTLIFSGAFLVIAGYAAQILNAIGSTKTAGPINTPDDSTSSTLPSNPKDLGDRIAAAQAKHR